MSGPAPRKSGAAAPPRSPVPSGRRRRNGGPPWSKGRFGRPRRLPRQRNVRVAKIGSGRLVLVGIRAPCARHGLARRRCRREPAGRQRSRIGIRRFRGAVAGHCGDLRGPGRTRAPVGRSAAAPAALSRSFVFAFGFAAFAGDADGLPLASGVFLRLDSRTLNSRIVCTKDRVASGAGCLGAFGATASKAAKQNAAQVQTIRELSDSSRSCGPRWSGGGRKHGQAGGLRIRARLARAGSVSGFPGGRRRRCLASRPPSAWLPSPLPPRVRTEPRVAYAAQRRNSLRGCPCIPPLSAVAPTSS